MRDERGIVRALKVLDTKLRDDETHRARFVDEARIQLERLDHPNIVKVYEILSTDEAAALVMEYVDGVDLGEYIETLGGPVSYPEFLAIALPVVNAVGHAHDRGVIHRDLKPANVLLARVGDRIVPKISDFGVAKLLTDSAKKKSTATGATIGTTGYMSPEQVKGSKRVTARSDVFSLGAMLYELASGVAAFDANSDYEIMDAIVKGRFRRTAIVAPALPALVAAAIDRALSPIQDARFGSCAELARALEVSEPAVAIAGEHSEPVARRSASWVLKSRGRDADPTQRWVWMVGIAAIVIGLAMMAKCAFDDNDEPEPSHELQMYPGRGFTQPTP